ncbi:hypothetical protein ABK040_012706 [Willaertia magna]
MKRFIPKINHAILNKVNSTSVKSYSSYMNRNFCCSGIQLNNNDEGKIEFSAEELEILSRMKTEKAFNPQQQDNNNPMGMMFRNNNDFKPDYDLDLDVNSFETAEDLLEALRNRKPRENEDFIQGRDPVREKKIFNLVEELLNDRSLDPTQEQIEECKRRATLSLLEMDDSDLVGAGDNKFPVISYDELNKKFYRKVYIEDINRENKGIEYRVRIGQEQLLRTTTNKIVYLPTKDVACVVAGEWEFQEDYVRPATLPITELVCRMEDVRRENDFNASYNMRRTLHGFFDGEFVCLRQGMSDEDIKELIKKHWDPLIEWFNKEYNTKLIVLDENSSFSDDPTQEDAREKFVRRYTSDVGLELFKKTDNIKYLFDMMSPAALVLMQGAVEVSGSIVIAAALFHGVIDAKEAAMATQLPLRQQTNIYGLVMGEHDLQFAEQICKLSAIELLLNIHPLAHDISEKYRKFEL